MKSASNKKLLSKVFVIEAQNIFADLAAEIPPGVSSITKQSIALMFSDSFKISITFWKVSGFGFE